MDLIKTTNKYGERTEIITNIPRTHEMFKNRTWRSINLENGAMNVTPVEDGLVICDKCNQKITTDEIFNWNTFMKNGLLGNSAIYCKRCHRITYNQFISSDADGIVLKDISFRVKKPIFFGLDINEIKEIVDYLKNNKDLNEIKEKYQLDEFKLSAIRYNFMNYDFSKENHDLWYLDKTINKGDNPG